MKRREIFIELTSLLDVILIMIFVLLTQARTQTAQAMDQAAEESAAAREYRAELREAQQENTRLKEEAAREQESLREEIDRLEEKADALGRELLTEGLVMENSLILTISIDADHSVLLEQGQNERHTIAYDWDNGTYTYNSLRSLLRAQLENVGEKTLFLVFQYDSSKIYHAEYELILQTVQEMRLEARQKEIPMNFLEMDIHE